MGSRYDIAKHFDTVNHNKFMTLVIREIKDKRVLKQMRLFLQSGIMIETEEGCLQRVPLSQLLSNIILTEPDRELEKSVHKSY